MNIISLIINVTIRNSKNERRQKMTSGKNAEREKLKQNVKSKQCVSIWTQAILWSYTRVCLTMHECNVINSMRTVLHFTFYVNVATDMRIQIWHYAIYDPY